MYEASSRTAGVRTAYFAITMFASFTTLFHCSTSLLTRSRNCSGGPPAATMPSAASHFLTASDWMTFPNSLFMRSTMFFGKPFGPQIPYQCVTE